SASTSAWRISGSVGSRGSPCPKSMISIPAAAASRLARSIRTKGYVPCADNTGETCTARTLAAQERAQGVVAALECRDLDALVASVRVACRAGAEVDGVQALRRELRDRRPRLLGLDLEPPDLAQPLHERRAGRDVRRRRALHVLELRADKLLQARERLVRRP